MDTTERNQKGLRNQHQHGCALFAAGVNLSRGKLACGGAEGGVVMYSKSITTRRLPLHRHHQRRLHLQARCQQSALRTKNIPRIGVFQVFECGGHDVKMARTAPTYV